jgi:ribonucleoside-diphosphate reductase alpha chain
MEEAHMLDSQRKSSGSSRSHPSGDSKEPGPASAQSPSRVSPRKGAIPLSRRNTRPGIHPFEEIEWEVRSALITNEKGETVFEQNDVEVPKFWSQLATNIVVQKYFRGELGTPARERSVKQLIGRVAQTIAGWGLKDGYFATEAEGELFEAELAHLLVYQKMSFNSPVWFNIGIEPKPQGSACFINSVSDTMQSILELAKTEGMLFKYGSGTGSNLSGIRSSKEVLAGGGTASGPVSFMRGYDAFAGVIKSGGKTRRAAKMVILNADHPDILEFIRCKASEEKKAWSLIEAGYDPGFNVPGGAYDSVFFQNANHSIRVTDEFMKAVIENRDWDLRKVTTGETLETINARDLMSAICEAAWICGDPGLQFDTTINDWNPCINSARINASNPCSEYMFLDDSACNLASLNLMKFRRPEDGEFDITAFRHAVDTTILAQEIIVDNASYPTPAIAKNSHEYRPLGLGYANLGALLMSRAVPYDSGGGRAYAAAITSLMCGEAYLHSARIAEAMGAFAGYAPNSEPFSRVIKKHRDAAHKVSREDVPEDLLEAAREVWDEALARGEADGFRNAQVTVLAPTGTIAFMMDCDTTGIEPDIALVKYKKLVGGGLLKIVNNTVPLALNRLGYSRSEMEAICDYIDLEGTIEGAPHLKKEHLPVFDCAFRSQSGTRSIHYSGHIAMMGAVQPFLSGAISKTVNLPETASVEEIEKTYIEGWKLGLKAIAIYRDGCKRTQPLSTAAEKKEPSEPALRPLRRRLPDERQSITHKFSIAGHEGYITVGMYEDGSPGEIFVTMAKQGSVVSGLMDSFATAISLTLQYGVPLRVLCDKFSHSRFEPSGITNNPQIPFAKSIADYLFRWLALKFLPREQVAEITARRTDESGSGIAEAIGSTDEGEAPEGEPPDDPAAAKSTSPATEAVPVSPDAGFASALPGHGPAVSTKGNGRPAKGNGHSRESIEMHEKRVYAAMADAPPCQECGEIMIRNGSCYACVNCGATSGCS